MHPLQINPPAERWHLYYEPLRLPAAPPLLLPISPLHPPLILSIMRARLLLSPLARRAQIQISPRPHILKMSVPIYGSDEKPSASDRHGYKLFCFSMVFPAPENRVAGAYPFLGEQTSGTSRCSGNVSSHWGFVQREMDTEEFDYRLIYCVVARFKPIH